MENNKITYLENGKIIFNKMNGKLINNEYLDFIKNGFEIEKFNINIGQYDYIYILDNKWAGTLLLIKGNKYRTFNCGSGRPFITESEINGTLV